MATSPRSLDNRLGYVAILGGEVCRCCHGAGACGPRGRVGSGATTAAGVFICLVALLYIINPAGMRAALKVLADKVDAWLAKAHEWLDGLKGILSAFQSAAQAAAGVSQEEKKQGFDEATPEPKPQDKDEMEQTPNRN